MFLAGITDFLFPDLIANAIEAIQAHDQEQVIYRIKIWIIIIAVGAVSTAVNTLMFGMISERVGHSLRTRFFRSLIYKDTAFYD